MVAVFVRDQDRGQIFRSTADAGQPLADLTGAEAGVNQQPRFRGLDIGAISPGTASQNGNPARHGPNLGTLRERINDFSEERCKDAGSGQHERWTFQKAVHHSCLHLVA